ncbi:hypothetical protein KCP73_19330 [Salmonella enterica subsp. enterica]|nr:hypothetical protein KCP73_19330 [Salmonella enterica subsp. enterica]
MRFLGRKPSRGAPVCRTRHLVLNLLRKAASRVFSSGRNRPGPITPWFDREHQLRHIAILCDLLQRNTPSHDRRIDLWFPALRTPPSKSLIVYGTSRSAVQ